MSCGIYKIENLINHKIYIGKSINISTRWREHQTNYLNLSKDCTLYRAMRKYGLDNFSFSILEECEPINEILNTREQYWINYYDSFKKGYNDTYGGDGALKNSYLEIRQLWDKGLSSGEIKRKMNCTEKVLNNALKDYSNYGIKEANRRGSNTPEALENKRKASMKTCNSKPVYQYSLEGEYLNEYDCPMAASKALGKGVTSHINNVLNGKSKIAFGYLWSYEKKDKIPPYIPKSISVLNKETGIIFPSLNKAGKWCGASGQKIKNACKNGNSIETNMGLLTWEFYKKEKSMSKFLSNVRDLEALQAAIEKCKGDVILRKNDGSEEFNMKSQISRYIAWNRLSTECGTDYEIFCLNKNDEVNLLKYFYDKTR